MMRLLFVGALSVAALATAHAQITPAWDKGIQPISRESYWNAVACGKQGGDRQPWKQWEGVRIQRCTTHKLENLKAHCPQHARAEMKRDYDRIIYAADGLAARCGDDAFVKKWSTLCLTVAKSLQEAGLELLTFYDFPKDTWKSIRTTNTIENLNREFRRRTKTQASFSTEAAALTVLYGLVAFTKFNCGRSMATSSCHRSSTSSGRKSRKGVEWSTVQQTRYAIKAISTRLGTDPANGGVSISQLVAELRSNDVEFVAPVYHHPITRVRMLPTGEIVVN